jgi:PPOX class probable FMN-dependent enzyme
MTGNNHVIDTLDALRARYGEPGERSLQKVARRLTPPYQKLLEVSPFFAIASSGPEGLDCSPRGDRGAAIAVLDDRTVAIPDWPGNNRLDSLQNLIRDPRCALLFLIPGVNETLRINGRAEISIDPGHLERFDVNGKKPATIILVRIDELYFQCAKALLRSRLWDPELHRNRANLPGADELVRSVTTVFDATSDNEGLSNREARNLY